MYFVLRENRGCPYTVNNVHSERGALKITFVFVPLDVNPFNIALFRIFSVYISSMEVNSFESFGKKVTFRN